MKKLITPLFLITLLAACHSNRVTLSQHVIGTSKITEPTKEGKACHSHFFIFSSSDIDLSVESARKDGKITEITSVENRDRGFFPFFFERCTVVIGN